jgi:translation initiation factor 1
MKLRKDKNSGIVYSTTHGRMCPRCERPAAACVCRRSETVPLGDGIVRIGRVTKGRKGKCVTVVTGLPLAGSALRKLAKELKETCGAGGTTRGGVIEIQGEHRDSLVEELRRRGYTAKRSGG